jgi:hypothetical protein
MLNVDDHRVYITSKESDYSSSNSSIDSELEMVLKLI